MTLALPHLRERGAWLSIRASCNSDFRNMCTVTQSELTKNGLAPHQWVAVESLREFSQKRIPPLCVMVLLSAVSEQNSDGGLSRLRGTVAETGVTNRFLHLSTLLGVIDAQEVTRSADHLQNAWIDGSGPPTVDKSSRFDVATSAYSSWILRQMGRESKNWDTTVGGSSIGGLIAFATDPMSDTLGAAEVAAQRVLDSTSPSAQELYALSWAISSERSAGQANGEKIAPAEAVLSRLNSFKHERVSISDLSFLLRASCLIGQDHVETARLVRTMMRRQREILSTKSDLYAVRLACAIALMDASNYLGDSAPQEIWAMPFWLPDGIGPPPRLGDFEWRIWPSPLRRILVRLDSKYRVLETMIGSCIGALIVVSLFDSTIPREAINTISNSLAFSLGAVALSVVWTSGRRSIAATPVARVSWFNSVAISTLLYALVSKSEFRFGDADAPLAVLALGFGGIAPAVGILLAGLGALPLLIFSSITALVIASAVVLLKKAHPTFVAVSTTVIGGGFVVYTVANESERHLLVSVILMSFLVDLISLTLDENGWLRRITG